MSAALISGAIGFSDQCP